MGLDIQKVVNELNKLAIESGKIALSYFHKKIKQGVKSDNTVFTEADTSVEQFLKVKLLELLPESSFVGEESSEGLNDSERLKLADCVFDKDYFWAVDPIDGTNRFISGSSSWGVSIGLFKKKGEGFIPFLGVIFLPVQDKLFYTDSEKSFMISGVLNGKNEKKVIEEIIPEKNNFQKDLMGLDTVNFRNHTFSHMNGFSNGCTVERFGMILQGECIGSMTAGHIWDFGAGLSIMLPVNVGLYYFENGVEIKEFTKSNLVLKDKKMAWCLKSQAIACNNNIKDDLISVMKKG